MGAHPSPGSPQSSRRLFWFMAGSEAACCPMPSSPAREGLSQGSPCPEAQGPHEESLQPVCVMGKRAVEGPGRNLFTQREAGIWLAG